MTDSLATIVAEMRELAHCPPSKHAVNDWAERLAALQSGEAVAWRMKHEGDTSWHYQQTKSSCARCVHEPLFTHPSALAGSPWERMICEAIVATQELQSFKEGEYPHLIVHTHKLLAYIIKHRGELYTAGSQGDALVALVERMSEALTDCRRLLSGRAGRGNEDCIRACLEIDEIHFSQELEAALAASAPAGRQSQ